MRQTLRIAPPAIIRPADDLHALGKAINAAHRAGEAARQKGLEWYRQAGQDLLRVQDQLPRGKWLRWLRDNVECSQRQAYRYMELAKVEATASFEELEQEWQRINGHNPAQAPGK